MRAAGRSREIERPDLSAQVASADAVRGRLGKLLRHRGDHRVCLVGWHGPFPLHRQRRGQRGIRRDDGGERSAALEARELRGAIVRIGLESRTE